MSNSELTKTEGPILIAVNLGYTNNEIAAMMVVSRETIRTHCQHIKRKIGDQWPLRKGAGHGGRRAS
jgi:DNA-binding CsgD family transcriptional regulator